MSIKRDILSYDEILGAILVTNAVTVRFLEKQIKVLASPELKWYALKRYEKKNIVLWMFINFRKVFDRVNHELFIKNLDMPRPFLNPVYATVANFFFSLNGYISQVGVILFIVF